MAAGVYHSIRIALRFKIAILRVLQASVMKLVDIGDSKSPVLTDVAVRVRPLVPYVDQGLTLLSGKPFFFG